MRKILLIILIIICICAIFMRKEQEKEIRVRIIPNGNTYQDLNEKNKAKEVVLCYLDIIYDESYDTCKSNIQKTYKELENSLKKDFKNVSVTFDKHTLYNKTYNNNAIKNTEAYTLYVILGNGNGDNWWGSIYPEFLGVSGDTELKYESLLVNVVKKIKEK